jgi:BRO-like protein
MIIDGKEYFPATQCAKILGYADPFKAVKQHCHSKEWVNRPVLTNGGSQNVKFITEGNL